MTDLTQLELGARVRFKGYLRTIRRGTKPSLTVGAVYRIDRRTSFTTKIWITNDLGILAPYSQEMFEIVDALWKAQPTPFRPSILPSGGSR